MQMSAGRVLDVPSARATHSGGLRRARVTLEDGSRTTVYVAAYDLRSTEVRVVVLPGQQPLETFCARRGVADALVGGFFTRPRGLPLGEVRTGGVKRRSVPFHSPYDAERACVHVQGGRVDIALRNELELDPRGDLLQAGPMLVSDGAAVYDRAADPEGFSAGAAQFDSDITDGRHPRAALGLGRGRLLAVACDGRSSEDAGLTLEELAAVLVFSGARTGLNLDGGGSTSLVAGGRLRNRPRGAYELAELGGRPVSTALLFMPR